MKIETISRKGSSPCNEDAIVYNERLQLFGVIDGATSLVPFVTAEGETGGLLAAQVISRHLNADSLQAPEGPDQLLALLSEANDSLRKEMHAKGVSLNRKEELWSACAVVIHIHEQAIDYAHAGDCMLIAYYQDSTVRVVTHDQLAHVDRLTLERWMDGVAAGLSERDELWEHTKAQIIHGRQLANTVDGYAVLNGEPEFSRYAEYGRISRAGLKSILLVSDGLYIPHDQDHEAVNGAGELAGYVREMGLEKYVEWLTELEESDPQCLRFPRVKKSDDKSAILIEL